MTKTRFLLPGTDNVDTTVTVDLIRTSNDEMVTLTLTGNDGFEYEVLRLSAEGVFLFRGVDGNDVGVAVDKGGRIKVEREPLE